MYVGVYVCMCVCVHVYNGTLSSSHAISNVNYLPRRAASASAAAAEVAAVVPGVPVQWIPQIPRRHPCCAVGQALA